MSVTYEIVCDLTDNKIIELKEQDVIELARLALKQDPVLSFDKYIGKAAALQKYFSFNQSDRLLNVYKKVLSSTKATKILYACMEACELSGIYDSEDVSLEEDALYNYKMEQYENLLEENKKLVENVKKEMKGKRN